MNCRRKAYNAEWVVLFQGHKLLINKIKSLYNKPGISILVPAVVVVLHARIPLESRFNAIKVAIDDREKKSMLRI